MKKFAALLFSTSLIFIACSHYDELERDGIVSTSNAHSHNAGEDCMRCHHDKKNEASGRWWNVAGTIYYSSGEIASSAGVVELWTGPQATGKLVYRLPIDNSGNIYTQKISNFRDGYYPIIIHGNDTTYMPARVYGDDVYKSCNSCHGHNGDGLNTAVITIN
jgi:hypothetical protein